MKYTQMHTEKIIFAQWFAFVFTATTKKKCKKYTYYFWSKEESHSLISSTNRHPAKSSEIFRLVCFTSANETSQTRHDVSGGVSSPLLGPSLRRRTHLRRPEISKY